MESHREWGRRTPLNDDMKGFLYSAQVQCDVVFWYSPYQSHVRTSMHTYLAAVSAVQYAYVACNLRTCAVCRLHGAKYAVCRLHGTQSADCMVTVQTKDPSKTCDSFSKFQRNLRFSARINFLTKLPNLKENNLCLFDNGYYSFSCL